VAHRVCYLAGIFVAPAYRRQGLARALLAELKRAAAARGVKSIELDVWAFNEQARQAFVRLGFCGVMERMTSPIEE
jgi:ribosomal protein S18 acetylase RimI-like enzyme